MKKKKSETAKFFHGTNIGFENCLFNEIFFPAYPINLTERKKNTVILISNFKIVVIYLKITLLMNDHDGLSIL